MSVSVVIPTHNRIEHVDRLLFFLNKWESHKDIEVIISDDNSNVNYSHFISSIKDKYFFNIKYTGYNYAEPHLFRLAKARNEGAKIAEKDFLLILDCDRILSKNYIAKCIKRYNSQKKDCVIGGRTVYLNKPPSYWNDNISIDELEKEENVESQDRCLCVFHRNSVRDITDNYWANLYGGGIFIRRKTFNSFNGYDERYEGWGSEDNDFALMVRRSGARILLDWNLVMYHMWHPQYDTEYNLDKFVSFYKKHPFDFTLENRKLYSSKLTEEELRDNRS